MVYTPCPWTTKMGASLMLHQSIETMLPCTLT